MSNQTKSNTFRKMGKTISKHAPEILTAVGIGCMISSTVLAVKETPKALTLIEDKRKELEVDELTTGEIIKTAWKCYIPSIATSVIGVGCLVGASTANAKRSAAILTAYKLTETAFLDYKDKVVETIGENKEKTIRDKVAKKKIEENPVTQNNIIMTGNGDTLCCDMFCGRYFKSDIEKIKKAVNIINKKLLSYGYLSLNEFYDEIGLPSNDLGEELGWNIDNGLIEVYFGSHLTDNGTPCLTIEFENAPTYNYDKIR